MKITYQADAILVQCRYDPALTQLFKQLQGRWLAQEKSWRLPLEAYPRLGRHPAFQAHLPPRPAAEVRRVGQRLVLLRLIPEGGTRVLLEELGYRLERPGGGVWVLPTAALAAGRQDPGLAPLLQGWEPAPPPALPDSCAQHLLPAQRIDVEAIFQAYQAGRRGYLLANGTGTGKTYVYAALARWMEEAGHRVLVVLPNEDLLEQNRAVLQQFGATARLTTYHRFAPEEAYGRVLIYDEAHLLKGLWKTARGRKGYLGARQAFFALYVSATPFDQPWEAEYLQAIGVERLTGDRDFRVFIERFGVRYLEAPHLAREGRTPTLPVFQGSARDLMAFNHTLTSQGFMSKRLFEPPAGLVRYEAPLLEMEAGERQLLREVRRRLATAARAAPKQHRGLLMAFRTGLSRGLLERMKVRAVIPYLRELLQGGWSIFLVLQYRSERSIDLRSAPGLAEYSERSEVLAPYIIEALEGMHLPLPSPLALLEEAFGHLGPQLAFYTGREQAGALRKAKNGFNQQAVRLLVATGAKGGTGLSLHDTQGGRPTAQVVLSLPWTAIQLDQILGRVVRVGMCSETLIALPVARGVPMETGLSRVIGSRLATLGYVVRGGQAVVPPHILQAFEAGLALVDAEGFQQALEDFVQALQEETPTLG